MSETHGMDADQWERLSEQNKRTVGGAYAALRGAGVEAVGGFRITAPEFKPGDVIRVSFVFAGCAFTYLRHNGNEWRTYDGGLRTDSDMSKSIRGGKAVLILRDGQLTDDGARMAGERADLWSGAKVNALAMAKYGDSRAAGQIDAFRTGFVAARDLLTDKWTPFATEAGE